MVFSELLTAHSATSSPFLRIVKLEWTLIKRDGTVVVVNVPISAAMPNPRILYWQEAAAYDIDVDVDFVTSRIIPERPLPVRHWQFALPVIESIGVLFAPIRHIFTGR